MGLYELSESWSMLGFLNRGSRFMHNGKLPSCSDRLHRLQMTGIMYGARFSSSHVGRGSSGQAVRGADASID